MEKWGTAFPDFVLLCFWDPTVKWWTLSVPSIQ